MHARLHPLLLSILALSACATAPCPDTAQEHFSGGMTVHLERPLPLPADSTSLRIQSGRIVAANAVQETEPHCIFEVEDLHAEARVLAPARITVTGVQRGVSTFPGIHLSPAGFGRHGAANLYFYTEFRLRADPPLRARTLFCQINQAHAGIPRHLGLDEIRLALGTLLRLELPAGP